MPLNREQICALLPHGKAMCLLDEVISWDAEKIHCRSQDFATRHNSLFEQGQFSSVLLIEYAAQAAGVHAALLQPTLQPMQTSGQAAYIGAVKNIELFKSVSDNTSAIELTAYCLLNNSSGAIYDVVAQQEAHILMRGRLILSQSAAA